MSSKPLTLEIPEPIYRLLQDRAARSNRSIEVEALDALATATTPPGELPADLTEVLTQLSFLSDGELWRVARNPLPSELAAEMEQFHHKQQREGLTEPEQAALAQLVRKYERTMLLRAQAAALLKERGNDVS